MRLRILLLVCGLAALLPATPGQAATVGIDVRSNLFDPAVAHPVAGDTIRWTVRQGQHDVVAYAGTMSFASSLMNPMSPPFEQIYAGGEVLYRCTPHSTIASSGLCVGMCGVLSDRTGPPAAPAIASPSNGASLPNGAVTFSGTAEPWTIVRLREGASSLGEILAGGDGAWSLGVSMAGGSHTVTARADGADGTTGGSATVSFTVGGPPDTTPPEVAIGSGMLTGGSGSVGIFGEAFDDVAVSRVVVRAYDLRGVLLREVVADCPQCASPSVAWFATMNLPPGVALLFAVAEDTASPANRSAEAGPVYAITLPG